MTADSQKDIEYLKAIGRICAGTLRKMMNATRAGMTTHELDEIGRALLEAEGARSAPQITYNYPAATCISISPVIAHGIPDEHVLREGELIHIDLAWPGCDARSRTWPLLVARRRSETEQGPGAIPRRQRRRVGTHVLRRVGLADMATATSDIVSTYATRRRLLGGTG